MAAWIGVTADDPRGGSRPTSTSVTTSVTAPSPQPVVLTNDLVARLLPLIRASFAEQDWPQLARRVEALQQSVNAADIPSEVYQMQGRTLRAGRDYAEARGAWDVLCARDPHDVAALRAAAEARIALSQEGKPNELAAALPLLKKAITWSDDRSQRLALLRISAHALTSLVQRETGAAALTHWNEALRTANEGLQQAGAQDAGWLATKLEALQGLGHSAEALAIVRTLTARQDATAALWLTLARLAWQQAGETATDEVRAALDAAARLAPHDGAVTQARQEMLVILPPDRFPPHMATPELGFATQRRNGVTYILPPVCPVPGGAFLMGSDKSRDREAQPNEQPQKPIPVGDFAIGRFPITVAEYACFVEAARRRQPQQWPTQLQQLDHPVVYVSWDDAVAYAAWLAKVTQQPWRLATEAEWEKAARWDARIGIARLYPWGDTFDASRCNTAESGIRTTTAVGSYPTGASPSGAQDMAGNVWEWTHSLYQPYPYTLSDGRETENSTENRVLRGGSWNDFQRGARGLSQLRQAGRSRRRHWVPSGACGWFVITRGSAGEMDAGG